MITFLTQYYLVHGWAALGSLESVCYALNSTVFQRF